MGDVELNGATGIGIGDEGQSQRCKFRYDCLRFECKFCDSTGMKSWYGVGCIMDGFRLLNYDRNNVEVNISGEDRRSGGEGENLSCGKIYLGEDLER